jgi:hypothetical protein
MIECEFGTRQIKNGGRTRDRTLDLSRVKGKGFCLPTFGSVSY